MFCPLRPLPDGAMGLYPEHEGPFPHCAVTVVGVFRLPGSNASLGRTFNTDDGNPLPKGLDRMAFDKLKDRMRTEVIEPINNAIMIAITALTLALLALFVALGKGGK